MNEEEKKAQKGIMNNPDSTNDQVEEAYNKLKKGINDQVVNASNPSLRDSANKEGQALNAKYNEIAKARGMLEQPSQQQVPVQKANIQQEAPPKERGFLKIWDKLPENGLLKSVARMVSKTKQAAPKVEKGAPAKQAQAPLSPAPKPLLFDPKKDYYKMLGMEKGQKLTEQEIVEQQANIRNRTGIFKKINVNEMNDYIKASNVINNPEKRKQYDSKRAEHMAEASREKLTSNVVVAGSVPNVTRTGGRGIQK